MPQTINDYINQSPEEVRDRLKVIYIAMRSQVLEATETLGYGMPTLKLDGKNLIHFAPAAHHIGIYPGPAAVSHFADQLAGYKTSKGAIQLPNNKPIPIKLIKDITSWCVAQMKGGHI